MSQDLKLLRPCNGQTHGAHTASEQDGTFRESLECMPCPGGRLLPARLARSQRVLQFHAAQALHEDALLCGAKSDNSCDKPSSEARDVRLVTCQRQLVAATCNASEACPAPSTAAWFACATRCFAPALKAAQWGVRLGCWIT